MQIAIFGGSFNPPHVAHVLAAAYAMSTHPLQGVVVMPTYRHPFAKPLAAYEHRVRMAELAFEGQRGVTVSQVERDLGGESRTLRTLLHLREAHPEWSMRLLLGADILAESSKWHGFNEICAIAPPLVLGRVGFEAKEPIVLPDISSTHVRTLLREQAWPAVAPLVPHAVVDYVRAHGLYA